MELLKCHFIDGVKFLNVESLEGEMLALIFIFGGHFILRTIIKF